MARQIWQLKLTELHTQATQIAQEFKTIETSFGTHCVSKLLPLVVGVLERLELYVDEYEKLQTENAKLSLKLSDHDRTDSAGSGLDNYVIVVAPSDPELHTLGNRALERTSPNNLSSPTFRENTPNKVKPQATRPMSAEPRARRAVFSLNSPGTPSSATQFTYPIEGPSTEQQLQRARDELAAAQTAMLQLQDENLKLMTKLNQLSRTSATFEGDCEKQTSTAQRLKDDLLAVVIEKTALKEDMIALREELDVTKRQLKECIKQLSAQQQQLDMLDT